MPVYETSDTGIRAPRNAEERAASRWAAHEAKVDVLIDQVRRLVEAVEKDHAWRKQESEKIRVKYENTLIDVEALIADRDRYKKMLEDMRDIWARGGP